MYLPERDSIGLAGYGPYDPKGVPHGVAELYRHLCIDGELEDKLRRDIDDPEKHDEIWERIEEFKRKYPYLCYASDTGAVLHWEFVGERRIEILESWYGKYARTNTAVRQSIMKYKETVHRLLCRTYGKLSRNTLSDLLAKNDYRFLWDAIQDDELIYPVSHGYAGRINRGRESCRKMAEKLRAELPERLSLLDDSGHDIVVYITGLEFDQSLPDACEYIACLLDELISDRNEPIGPMPRGVIRATTEDEYREYLSGVGEDIPSIRESISKRAQKEIAAPKRPYPNNATYVPIPSSNHDIDHVLYCIRTNRHMADAPSADLTETVAQMRKEAKEELFRSPMWTVIYLILGFLTILSILNAIV